MTPHKIRAERPSNLSFQKLRGAGLTPHFHDERSPNVSLRARVSSRCSPPSLPHYRGPLLFLLPTEYLGYASTAGTSTRARCADAQRRWRCRQARLCVHVHFLCLRRHSLRQALALLKQFPRPRIFFKPAALVRSVGRCLSPAAPAFQSDSGERRHRDDP